MKPFRLHTVLDYRRTLENRATERLTRAREEVERLVSELEGEKARLQEIRREFEERKSRGTDVREILVFQTHLRRVREEIGGRELELESAREDAARKEEELLRASRERKLLERLKEKQDARYTRFLEEKEKKELDEVAVLFHQRGGI